jgi:hypothetical protein
VSASDLPTALLALSANDTESDAEVENPMETISCWPKESVSDFEKSYAFESAKNAWSERYLNAPLVSKIADTAAYV